MRMRNESSTSGFENSDSDFPANCCSCSGSERTAEFDDLTISSLHYQLIMHNNTRETRQAVR